MRLRKWLIPGLVAALLGLGGLAYAQFGPNTLSINSAPSGTAPSIRASGLDANVSINLVPKGAGTVQVSGAPIILSGGTFTSLNINPGPLNVTGSLFATPGTSATLEQVGGAVVFNSSADFTPAAAAVEETAYTFTLPANSLSADNQYLRVEWAATTAANANNKRFRLYFGATVVCDSAAAGFNNSGISATAFIYRTAAATQKGACIGFNGANGSAWSTASGGGYNFTTPGETLSNAVIVKLTILNATAAADSTAKYINMVWYPAGQ